MVVRVEGIVPRGARMMTVTYDSGGLSVSPASGSTMLATDDWATTGHIDFTIIRDRVGGTQRRVTFTMSTPDSGFVDGVDGVDVAPNDTRFRCKLYHTGTPSIANVTATPLAWDSELYDTGALHDVVTNNTRIVIPTGGDTGLWMFTAQVQWDTNTVGMREVKIRKNGSNDLAVSREAPIFGQLVHSVMATDDAPSVGDYYEAIVTQDSGAARTITGVASNFAAVHLV